MLFRKYAFIILVTCWHTFSQLQALSTVTANGPQGCVKHVSNELAVVTWTPFTLTFCGRPLLSAMPSPLQTP
jgi:hypothetical protein